MGTPSPEVIAPLLYGTATQRLCAWFDIEPLWHECGYAAARMHGAEGVKVFVHKAVSGMYEDQYRQDFHATTRHRAQLRLLRKIMDGDEPFITVQWDEVTRHILSITDTP